MSNENQAEFDEMRTAADVIGEAAWRVNWKPDEKHPMQARYDALRALMSVQSYSAAIAMETLRRIDPAAADRVAVHLGRDLGWDINAENAWAWEQALKDGQTIPDDAWPFAELVGQTEEVGA